MKRKPYKYPVHYMRYSDAWLEEIKQALKSPGFTIKPPKEVKNVELIYHPSENRRIKGKEIKNYNAYHELIKELWN